MEARVINPNVILLVSRSYAHIVQSNLGNALGCVTHSYSGMPEIRFNQVAALRKMICETDGSVSLKAIFDLHCKLLTLSFLLRTLFHWFYH